MHVYITGSIVKNMYYYLMSKTEYVTCTYINCTLHILVSHPFQYYPVIVTDLWNDDKAPEKQDHVNIECHITCTLLGMS